MKKTDMKYTNAPYSNCKKILIGKLLITNKNIEGTVENKNKLIKSFHGNSSVKFVLSNFLFLNLKGH